MKRLILIIFTFHILLLTIIAQAPQKFNYQAVVRNDAGTIITDQAVSIKISILEGSVAGTLVYSETHSPTTNSLGLVILEIGAGTTSDDFTAIDWGGDVYFMRVEMDPTGGSVYQEIGTSQLLSVPYALNAESVNDLKELNIVGDSDAHSDSALFEVKRSDGQTVFAVYPEGVRIYVEKETVKGTKGGFAIGGFSPLKGIEEEYLRVTQDSVRVYINDNPGTKGTKGGFAIGGFSPVKGFTGDYMNVSGKGDAEIINPSDARILWYPNKEAFLAGRVLIQSPDSVGTNSFATGFESKSIGNYSQALGYQARASGDNSTAIGFNANATGYVSYAFGNYAKAVNEGSYAIGSGALASGLRSFALGSTGVDQGGSATYPTRAIADYSYAIGMGCLASAQGAFSIGTLTSATGYYSLATGYGSTATGDLSTAMGMNSDAIGDHSIVLGTNSTASGIYSVALGYDNIASGNFSTAIGSHTEASMDGAISMGSYLTASGIGSLATGNHTLASGHLSVTMNSYTTASGYGSIAMGYETIASGYVSNTMGYNSIAGGDYSIAAGYHTNARSYNSFVIGRYNDTLTTSSPTSWIGTDPLFIVGNGSNEPNRNSALTVLKNGNIGIGTMTPQGTLDVNGSIYQRGGVLHADYVFEKDYELESIENHSEFMWENKHLPAVPKAIKDESGNDVVEWGARSRGVLEELEKAHVYINQLNTAMKEQQRMIGELKVEIEKLKETVNNQ